MYELLEILRYTCTFVAFLYYTILYYTILYYTILCYTTVLTRHYAPFDYKPLLTIVAEVYLSPIYVPLDHTYMENLIIHNKNGRTLRLRRLRGRLELTVPPYIESRPAIHRQSDWLRGGRLVASWWWCENCIAFSDRTHAAPSLTFALQN